MLRAAARGIRASFDSLDILAAVFVQVEITVPGAAELPAELHAHSQAQHCYHVAKMPLSGLLEPTLLAAIQSADVRAMSRGPKIDGENVAALLPTGELLLSLDKVRSQVTSGGCQMLSRLT